MRKARVVLMIVAATLAVTDAVAISRKSHHQTTCRSISKSQKEYKTYEAIVEQLQKWNKEAPSITEFCSYGKTSQGTTCNYLRVGTPNKPKVLIQAGLNGDEEFAILANMKFIEKLLCKSNKDEQVEWLIKNRDIYFIPVLSPDTYLKSHDVEGHDTQTSFPYPQKPNNTSPSPIKLIMDLTHDMKFKAVLSSHTYGEKLVQPEICNPEDGDKIEKLMEKIAGMNGYQTLRINNTHGTGSDVDWFYSTGACSLKMLWGKSAKQFVSFCDLEPSVERSFTAICTFIKEAVEIDLNPRPLRSIYYYQAD